MQDHNNPDNSRNQDDDKPLTFFQMLGSVLAAFIGIQSEKNRERDFKKMKPHHVLIAGLLLVAVFMGTVIAIVSSILATH